jgi:iron complex outermembrane receptor protein
VFMDYRNASGYDETTGLFFSRSRDFSGNRVPRSPEWSGNLGLNQLLDFALGPVELGVDLYYNGGFFYTAQNTETARQAAYSLLNARASWTYQPWNLKLTIFGQNLDDETYSYGGFTEDFGTGYTLAPPRTYGVRMNWEF